MYAWKGLELSLGSKQFIQSTSNMPIAGVVDGVDGYGLRRHLNSLISYNINFVTNGVLHLLYLPKELITVINSI